MLWFQKTLKREVSTEGYGLHSGEFARMTFAPAPPNTGLVFVAWFTFGDDTASGQRWFTAQGGFEGSVAELDVYETTNGSFDDPRAPDTLPVGTMVIDFVDCSNAQLTYSITAESLEGSVAIQRVVPGSKALCEEISGTQ